MSKYFIYARKSSGDEEKQILSIKAQLQELRDFANKERLEVVDEFVETKTAKEPSRPIFNQMLDKIERGEAEGILAWHPDRLARNSVDGGRIIYLIDSGKIKELKFPTFWFESTPQGKFMLNIAFGQSKYYVDNLSENVKRDLRQKLRRGEWPGQAPIGYVNNLRNHTIEIDREKAPIIKKIFKAYASDKYTLKDLADLSFSLGLVSQRKRKGLSVAVIQRMLENKFYIGLFTYRGETYEGKHKPIIDKSTFDKVQQILKERAKPRKTKALLDFPFRAIFKCGECGRAVTGEQHIKKSGLIFRYYRCTKKKTMCQQEYIREEELSRQIDKIISKFAWPKIWFSKMLDQVEKWKNEKEQFVEVSIKPLREELRKIEAKISKLLDAHLERLLEADEYHNKKAELLEKKVILKQKIAQIGQKGNGWLEPLENWLKEVNQVQNLISRNNLREKGKFLRKIGSNLKILDGKIVFTPVGVWKTYLNFFGREQKFSAAEPRSGEAALLTNLVWRYLLDKIRTFFDENPDCDL
jgi:DNA invertase Pin-like site-specific DNA recombinase